MSRLELGLDGISILPKVRANIKIETEKNTSRRPFEPAWRSLTQSNATPMRVLNAPRESSIVGLGWAGLGFNSMGELRDSFESYLANLQLDIKES
jgi:hypothetical protein